MKARPPNKSTIDMSKEPSCAKQHATPITTETVVTGPSNALENVVVYISAGAPDERGAVATAQSSRRRAANIFRMFWPFR